MSGLSTVQQCIRRPGSEWTLCACSPCRVEMRRKSKLARNGVRIVDDQRDAARRRIDSWVEAGYSIGLVASMTGIRKATLARHLSGDRTQISHSTARRIMAANPYPIDAGGFVSSVGTWRRLRALTVMGWSMTNLAERTGVKPSTLHALRDPKHALTRPKYAHAVAEVYAELCMTHGPCQYAATRARRKGWLPPLAWDNIDDPHETPSGDVETDREHVDEAAVLRRIDGDRVRLTKAERHEVVRRLHSRGLNDADIQRLTGIDARQVIRDRQHLGLRSAA